MVGKHKNDIEQINYITISTYLMNPINQDIFAANKSQKARKMKFKKMKH